MATIQELESFNLSDAVSFHEELNPQLWEDEKLDVEVRDQLLLIAEDFVEYLGISNLKVKDVTISGSNAAYSYTPHSDLDLHILVDFNDLPDNEVYQELFTAKKTLYNDAHDITVHGVPVELYVQDTNQVHTSLGEYSVVYDKWIRIPKKRRANFDEAAKNPMKV
jgi:predicted nucleotidyltransferase